MAKSSKYRGRSRFFKCFRPHIIDDDEDEIMDRGHEYISKDPNSKHVDGGIAKENTGTSPKGKHSKKFRRSRTEKFCRNFSDAFKSVFSDASLVKKNQRKAKCSSGSSSNLSSTPEKISQSMKESDTDEISRTNSNASSLFSSSTLASSISTSSSCASSRSMSKSPFFLDSRSMNNNMQVDNTRGRQIARHYNKNIAICFLLICLLVLIFYGKAFAIFCTSTWLYFAPRCFKSIDSSVRGLQSSCSLDVDRTHNRLL